MYLHVDTCRCIDIPGVASGKEPACQCRRHKRRGFDPWIGKILWRKAWQPTPVFLFGKSHGQRSLVGYSPWGHKESDMISNFFFLYSFPLQFITEYWIQFHPLYILYSTEYCLSILYGSDVLNDYSMVFQLQVYYT